MQSYEVVREVENQCANNQMRDIFLKRSRPTIRSAGCAGLSRDGTSR
ncbi:MAG: hypothetical protein ACLR8U_03415 [Oscillospiraceae bacterium]